MKKPSPSPSPAAGSRWLVVALLSLAGNAGLVFWHFRSPVPAATPTPVPAAPAAATPMAPIWSRELAPYAALGSFMAENNRISDLKWTPAQFGAFQEGFRSSYEGRGLPLDDAATRLRDEISRRVQAMTEAERPDPVKDYFRMLREKEGVKQTASGLHYRVTDEGTGAFPTAADSVVLSFAARTPDGKPVPALGRTRVKLAVRDLLPGLAEGVQLLKVGGKGLIYVPANLSFKEADWPPQLPVNAPLIFFVEMHDIIHAP